VLADETAAPKLPTFKSTTPHDEFYPTPARRLGQTGRVLMAFKISSAGRAVDTRVAESEPKGAFESTATKYVQSLQFAVPADWDASGGTHHEYTISFAFRLSACGSVPREEPVTFPADYQPITITGSMICLAPPAKHTTQAEADRVYCEYMREQGVSPASCAKP
jgi:TonB family protein